MSTSVVGLMVVAGGDDVGGALWMRMMMMMMMLVPLLALTLVWLMSAGCFDVEVILG